MITCNLKGGLGNQLFQIFTLISLSIKYNIPFFFLDTEILRNGITTRYTYWNTFLSGLSFFLKNYTQVNLKTYKIIIEKSFSFNPIQLTNLNINYILDGYYQSPLYFNLHKSQICRLIKLSHYKNILFNTLSNKYDFSNTISMHFRIGDYKNLQLYHPVLDKTYYKNSLSFIQQTNKLNNVLYFYEESDYNDVQQIINYLKQYFTDINFICIDHMLTDWEQLLVMSLCKHNIIANSTYSWWGAYLNDSVSKIVCYPKEWFGPKNADKDTTQLFMPDWIQI